MKNELHRLSLTAAALLALLLVPGLSAAEVTTYELTMTGEGPPPGAPDGEAEGTLALNSETGEVTWDFRYTGIAEPTAMHIHQGAAGASGGVAVPLNVESPEPGRLVGSTMADPERLQAIQAAPGDYYVNIHNPDYPPGAVRGQLAE